MVDLTLLAGLLGLCATFFLSCGTVVTPASCGATNCTGCCDIKGVCQGGTAEVACGRDGSRCESCPGSLVCSASGVCGNGGGPGGGSGAGGGTGGLGGGTGGGGGGGATAPGGPDCIAGRTTGTILDKSSLGTITGTQNYCEVNCTGGDEVIQSGARITGGLAGSAYPNVTTWNPSTCGSDSLYFGSRVGTATIDDVCLQGGVFTSRCVEGTSTCWTAAQCSPAPTPWEDPGYHSVPAIRTYYGRNYLIEKVRVFNVGDAIGFNYGELGHDNGNQLKSRDWVVRYSALEHIHDDCIENDMLDPGIVYDNFMSCFVAFSARTSTGTTVDGSGNTLQILNNLVWLRGVRGPDTGVAPYSINLLGPGAHVQTFHKWLNSSGAPNRLKVAFHDNVYRADGDPSMSNAPSGMWGYVDPADIVSSTNNFLCWFGTGSAPPSWPNPPGWTVLTSSTTPTAKAKWNQAVADWQNRHPDVPLQDPGIVP